MVVEYVMGGEVFFSAAPLYHLIGHVVYDPTLLGLYH